MVKRRSIGIGGRSLSIGERLQWLRESHGISRADVASKIGINRNSIMNYEKNDRDVPSSILNKLAELYGVPMDWFFLEDYVNEGNVDKEIIDLDVFNRHPEYGVQYSPTYKQEREMRRKYPANIFKESAIFQAPVLKPSADVVGYLYKPSNIERFVYLDTKQKKLSKGDEAFFWRIGANNMAPLFHIGDLALIKRPPNFENGDICLAKNEAGLAGLYYVHRIKNTWILISNDHKIQPEIIITNSNIVIGRVVFQDREY